MKLGDPYTDTAMRECIDLPDMYHGDSQLVFKLMKGRTYKYPGTDHKDTLAVAEITLSDGTCSGSISIIKSNCIYIVKIEMV